MPNFASQSGRKSVPLIVVKRFGTVAQLDNASGYGPEDWGFESLRYHDFAEPPFGAALFLFICVSPPTAPSILSILRQRAFCVPQKFFKFVNFVVCVPLSGH